MNRITRLACLAALTFRGLCGQALPSLPTFEVATVRPADRTGQPGHGTFAASGSRVSFTGYTLTGLIQYAYDVRGYQISGGPGWMGSDTYTIVAKTEGDTPRETAEIRQMLQGLLAERFGVRLHRDMKETSVYVLSCAKNGPTLTQSSARRTTMQMGPGHLMMGKATTSQMASLLSSVLSRAVLDQTGITGEFDFTLDSPDINMRSMQPLEAGPSIFTAIQEQLGLKLEPSKGRIEMLVIDSVAKPLDN